MSMLFEWQLRPLFVARFLGLITDAVTCLVTAQNGVLPPEQRWFLAGVHLHEASTLLDQLSHASGYQLARDTLDKLLRAGRLRLEPQELWRLEAVIFQAMKPAPALREVGT